MSGWEYFKECYTENYVNFSGRARRREYWYFFLFSMILSYGLMFAFGLSGMMSDEGEPNLLLMGIYGLFTLATFLPSLAVSIRRLHDIGKSGWFLLISLIPLIGAVVLFIFFIQDSRPETNKYGPNPKSPDEDEIIENLI